MNKKQLVIFGAVVAVILIVIAAVWGLNRGMDAQTGPEAEAVMQPPPPPKEARPPRPPKGGELRPPKGPRPPRPEGEEGMPGNEEGKKPPKSPQEALSAFINGTDGEPVKPIDKEEALTGAREFLDTYRNMSDEDKMSMRIGVGIMKGILDNLNNEAENMVAQMPEERKMEILDVYEENTQALLELEEELNDEMDDEEKTAFGPIVESFKNLNKGFYDAIIESNK